MRRPPLANRRDRNQAEIFGKCRAAGFSVVDTSRLGGDYPDGNVGLCGIERWVEIKYPGEELTEGQARFAETWKGPKPILAHCFEDILDAFNAFVRET